MLGIVWNIRILAIQTGSNFWEIVFSEVWSITRWLIGGLSWWFGIPGIPSWKELLLRGTLFESQTTKPNQ